MTQTSQPPLSGRALRAAVRSVIEGIKRLEAWSLPGFHSVWHETSVGPVHVLEFGRPAKHRSSWVFIHGYASQAVDWAPLLRRMHPHCGHILAVDLPGHGRSPIPTGGLSEEPLKAALLEAVTKSLGPSQRCTVVGNSMGGLAAIRLAQALSSRQVRELILISPLGGPMSAAEIDTALTSFKVDTMQEAYSLVDRIFMKKFAGRTVAACGMWALLSRAHLRQMAEQLRNFTFLDKAELRDLPPTLLIWGGGDTILPQRCRTFFEWGLPDYHLVATPHFSHAPYFQLSNEVFTTIAGWAAGRDGLLQGVTLKDGGQAATASEKPPKSFKYR